MFDYVAKTGRQTGAVWGGITAGNNALDVPTAMMSADSFWKNGATACPLVASANIRIGKKDETICN